MLKAGFDPYVHACFQNRICQLLMQSSSSLVLGALNISYSEALKLLKWPAKYWCKLIDKTECRTVRTSSHKASYGDLVITVSISAYQICGILCLIHQKYKKELADTNRNKLPETNNPLGPKNKTKRGFQTLGSFAFIQG